MTLSIMVQILLSLLSGLGGVVIGVFLETIRHWHSQRTDIYKRVLVFYRGRSDSLQVVEGNLVEEFKETDLKVARAPLRTELLLIAPPYVIDAEQEMYEFMNHRESVRQIKIYFFRQTGIQTPRRVGLGSHETMAISYEELCHGHYLFDEAYKNLENILRSEMSYWKTIKGLLSSQKSLKPLSQFDYLNPIYRINERMYCDHESVEAIWRGRIADQMTIRGDKPFDVYAFTEKESLANIDDLRIELNPPTPGSHIVNERPVVGTLGYESIFIFSQETLAESKQKVSQYFQIVPEGKIILKKRLEKNKREWVDVVSVEKSEVNKLFQIFDETMSRDLQKKRDYQISQEKKWAEVLKNAGKALPKVPMHE